MPPSPSEARVQATFDAVSSGYDHPNLAWFDRTATAIVGLSGLTEGGRALDVATGTGKVALELGRRTPGSEVVGVDLSSGMLAEAQRKAHAEGLSHVTFQQSSFEEMSFARPFDVVTCSFGLFFVEDMAKALAHFAEQARSGGRLILSTFALGGFSPFSDAFFRLYESFGFETRPPAWLRVASPELLSALSNQAALPRPSVTRHEFGFSLGSAEDWWDVVYNAGYRGMLLAMTETQQLDFKEQHLRDVQALIDGGQSRVEVPVLIAVIEKA